MAKKTIMTALMAVLSMLCGLCGCKKEPKPAQHQLSDVTSVSISLGNMDRRYGYYFLVHKEDGVWLFDAECFTHEREVETALENREVSSEYIDELFRILEQTDSIAYAENYKAPIRLPIKAMDESSCSFCLTFSDGTKCVTEDTQSELEEFFYRLAESLSPVSAQHEASDITAVSLFSSHMDFNYCYSFYIHKKEDVWLFDAECFTYDHAVQTVFENFELLSEDVEALLEIIERENMISYVENYVKPDNSPYELVDATTYSFSLDFSDGNSYLTSGCQRALEDLFYSLAEKYGDSE